MHAPAWNRLRTPSGVFGCAGVGELRARRLLYLLAPRTVDFEVKPTIQLQEAEMSLELPIPQATTVSLDLETNLTDSDSLSARTVNTEVLGNAFTPRMEIKSQVRPCMCPRTLVR